MFVPHSALGAEPIMPSVHLCRATAATRVRPQRPRGEGDDEFRWDFPLPYHLRWKVKTSDRTAKAGTGKEMKRGYVTIILRMDGKE